MKNQRLARMIDDIYYEQNRIQAIHGINTIPDFNQAIRDGRDRWIVNVSEALQDRHICHVADQIAQCRARVVLIAGPSSSGKTSFSRRLSIHLMATGLVPVAISLDDYYVDTECCPKDDKGDYDFESIYALNIALLNKHLNQLFAGKTVELPRYDFKQGKSILQTGNMVRLDDSQILILEGIHGLNPLLTEGISPRDKYSIYVAPLTSIVGLDGHHVDVTDNRLLRRIIRDYKYRNTNAASTIRRWPSVRAGEEKWILPFRGNADAMVNTSLLYELPAIKQQAVEALTEVPLDSPERQTAERLLAILEPLEPMDHLDIPPISLLREFLGGSRLGV